MSLVKSVVLQVRSQNQQHQHHLGISQEVRFSGLTQDLLNQNTLGWGLAIYILTSYPGNSDAFCICRTIRNNYLRILSVAKVLEGFH